MIWCIHAVPKLVFSTFSPGMWWFNFVLGREVLRLKSRAVWYGAGEVVQGCMATAWDVVAGLFPNGKWAQVSKGPDPPKSNG